MSELIVSRITPDQALALWNQIEPWLKPALAEEGFYLPIDIMMHHIRGEMQMWAAVDPDEKTVEAVMVTQIHVYPRKKVCSVAYIQGKRLSDWRDKFVAASEEFAKAMGCAHMCGGHREGWARVAGYRIVGPVLVKDLT